MNRNSAAIDSFKSKAIVCETWQFFCSVCSRNRRHTKGKTELENLGKRDVAKKNTKRWEKLIGDRYFQGNPRKTVLFGRDAFSKMASALAPRMKTLLKTLTFLWPVYSGMEKHVFTLTLDSFSWYFSFSIHLDPRRIIATLMFLCIWLCFFSEKVSKETLRNDRNHFYQFSWIFYTFPDFEVLFQLVMIREILGLFSLMIFDVFILTSCF